MATLNYNLDKFSCLNQVGLALSYFAMISYTRSREALAFTRHISHIAQQCLRKCTDPSTVGRGMTALILFTSHLLTPIIDHLDPLNEVTELALLAGDKHLFL